MLSDRLENKLNEQVMHEFFSAYYYLSMASYFDFVNLNGFANFFKVQAEEEQFHAMKFYNFINDKGCKVNLLNINQPKTEFNSTKKFLNYPLNMNNM